jgi:mannose-6-phosphate isomerase-like protein (cupin superfamily)
MPTEKLLVVHEGRLTVYAGDTRYDLHTGDAFYFEVREPYRFVNTGKTRCTYYLVIVRPR